MTATAEDMLAIHDRAASYGVQQSNPLLDPTLHQRVNHKVIVGLADSRLKEVTRLRLLSDPGYPFWDISYCYGKLKDGELVRVDLGVGRLRLRYRQHLVEIAKAVGVYAKGLGLLDNVSTLR